MLSSTGYYPESLNHFIHKTHSSFLIIFLRIWREDTKIIYKYSWHIQTGSLNVNSKLFCLTINGDKIKIFWKWQVLTTYGINNPSKMFIHNIHCKIWMLSPSGTNIQLLRMYRLLLTGQNWAIQAAGGRHCSHFYCDQTRGSEDKREGIKIMAAR